MTRLTALIALALLSATPAAAEVLRTEPTCHIPADLPPSPELDTDATLNPVRPDVPVYVYKDVRLRGGVYAEIDAGAVIEQVVPDGQGAPVSAQSADSNCE